MGAKSDIEWTDASWSPIRARVWEIQDDGSGKERIGWHCEHASEGCRFCYSEVFNRRLGTGRDFKPGELYREENRGYHNGDVKVFLDEKMLLAPLRWRKPRMIFVCSMTDLFADFVHHEWIDKVFAVMALCPQHTFQVLTKRAQRMLDYFVMLNDTCARDDRLGRLIRAVSDDDDICLKVRWPLRNVWLGVSTERQQEADERIPLLLQTPAAVRFISAEPLIGPIDLTRFMWPVCGWWRGPHHSFAEAKAAGAECGFNRQALVHADARFLDWVIVGGESGPNARPMHPDWARSLRDQCAAAGVPFFFKQWGAWAPADPLGDEPQDFRYGEFHGGKDWIASCMCSEGDGVLFNVGKKSAGRLLDGQAHDGMPGR